MWAMKTVWVFTPDDQDVIRKTAVKRQQRSREMGLVQNRQDKNSTNLRIEMVGAAAEMAARLAFQDTGGRFPMLTDPDGGIDGTWGGANFAVKGSTEWTPSLIFREDERHMVADAGMVFAIGWPPGGPDPTSARFAGWVERSRWEKYHKVAPSGFTGWWLSKDVLRDLEKLYGWVGIPKPPPVFQFTP